MTLPLSLANPPAAPRPPPRAVRPPSRACLLPNLPPDVPQRPSDEMCASAPRNNETGRQSPLDTLDLQLLAVHPTFSSITLFFQALTLPRPSPEAAVARHMRSGLPSGEYERGHCWVQPRKVLARPEASAVPRRVGECECRSPCGAVLGHSLGALGHGMLGKLPRQNQTSGCLYSVRVRASAHVCACVCMCVHARA